MSRNLPPRADLTQLRHQAKDLLKSQQKGESHVCPVLRLLRRFAGSSDEQILSAELALHEAQYALAMDYGFGSWNELRTHVESHQDREASAEATAPCSYRQATEYYLRQDVTHTLWRVAQRRPLRFYYRSDRPLKGSNYRPQSTRLHCVPSANEFAQRVGRALEIGADSAAGFCPFFAMGNVANAPGEPDRPVGWDFALEVDRGQRESFRALLPALGVLEHFGVRPLAKYSGHRSLHLIIPAEQFPRPMTEAPDHAQWMREFDVLGELLARLSPGISTVMAKLAKDTRLSAPYSLHRYHGRVSIPLDLARAMVFDPAEAVVERFAGVTWTVDALDGPTGGMQELLDVAHQCACDPSVAARIGQEVFGRSAQWVELAEEELGTELRDRPVVAALVAGQPGAGVGWGLEGLSPEARQRLEAAQLVIDSPPAKAMPLKRMILENDTGPENPAIVRQVVAEALASWVEGGLQGAMGHVAGLAKSDRYPMALGLGVRLFGLIPEPRQAKAEALRGVVGRDPSPVNVMWAMALTEAAAEGPWEIDQQPQQAVRELMSWFGEAVVRRWAQDLSETVRRLFGSRKKFEYALSKV